MRIKKFHGIIVATWMMAGAAIPVSAKDYAIGTVFQDLFRIDYHAARKSVPLPPGDWIVVSRNERRSGASNIPIVQFILLRHTDSFVTGAISVLTHKELVNFRWSASKLCSSKKRRVAWHIQNDAYDGFEHCNVVYPIRGFNRRHKALRKTYEYIESKGLKGPNSWVRLNFARVQNDEMMNAQFSLPPEQYGFPRERKYSNTESPWSINNIHDHPKKKAFMEKTVAWAKSWQKLVDLGFDNNLSRETVQAHPRIDGMAALPAPKNRAAPIIAKPSSPPKTPAKILPTKVSKLAPPPKPVFPDGPLKPAQLKNMIGGQTASGAGEQSTAEIEFKPRGRLDGRTTLGNTDYEDSGRWSVDGTGRLCLKWNGEEFMSSTCFRTVKKGKSILMQDEGGNTIFVVQL